MTPPGGGRGRVHGCGEERRHAATVVAGYAPAGGGGVDARGEVAGVGLVALLTVT
jgi:hypothetical protein